jgi:DNA-binding transcriptional LysR family regulator
MLNLVWLRSFVALAEHRSFHGAAVRVGIAQPTVSQHIMKLEEQLEVLLFLRGKSGCDPTRAAQTLLPYARSMLNLSERAQKAVKATSLRVGASSNIGIYMLQPHVRSFMDSHGLPDVELTIDSNPAIARQLTDGELDIAVMEWWHPVTGFQALGWKREPVMLIVPPDHPCADLNQIDRESLATMALLGGEPGTGTGRLLAEFFGDSGPSPTVSRQLGSTEAVKQAVKSGLGVSLVLASSVKAEVQAGTLKAIPVSGSGLAKELMVICPETTATRPPVSTFVSHLCH